MANLICREATRTSCNLCAQSLLVASAAFSLHSCIFAEGCPGHRRSWHRRFFPAGCSKRRVRCDDGTSGFSMPAKVISSERARSLAVLVRTCCPTDATVTRIISWAEELAHEPNIDFHISVDVTRSRVAVERLRRAMQDSASRVHIHEYTEEELEKKFPVLTELRCTVPGGPATIPGHERSLTLAWGFHCECISLWRRSLPREGQMYDFVWVLEDDVGCSGKLADLLAAYAEDCSDLISSGSLAEPRSRHPKAMYGLTRRDSGWHWFDTSTALYERWADHQKVISPEFVQRFSRRLLEELAFWSDAGASAWSESMTPTVCLTLQMKCRSLSQDHIGKPFAWNGRVSETSWHAIVEAVRLGRENGRLFHALKF
eukprot:TRINITY_DN75951_c0_g1_i1.p1 TRINITY_DN75951_c0_g1~~TRINITY_DN75951_c0_g1_i1.p1  ORF type:complete len:380 (-),score=37.48 TRINITY_DN75951_c0_g1_i1:28-1143(-)